MAYKNSATQDKSYDHQVTGGCLTDEPQGQT